MPCALAYAPLILLHNSAALRIAGDMLESTELRAEASLVTVLRWRASSRTRARSMEAAAADGLEFIIMPAQGVGKCRTLIRAGCPAC